MANIKREITEIEYEGIVYEFQDADARKEITKNFNIMYSLNEEAVEALTEEIERATAAEDALAASKMDKIPGQGLSDNNLTDELKELIENPLVMTGCTASGSGRKGVVPAPSMGDQNKYLKADGTWDYPPNTTYGNATHLAAGLMSDSP